MFGEPHDIRGANVYIAPKVADITRNTLSSLGVSRSLRAEASVFIVDVLDNAPPEITMVAGLRGGVIGSREYLISGGASGAALSFKPAIDIKRSIFISYEFMRLHTDIASDVHHLLMTVGCKWVLTGSAADLVALVAKGPRFKREALAFIAESEHDSEDG